MTQCGARKCLQNLLTGVLLLALNPALALAAGSVRSSTPSHSAASPHSSAPAKKAESVVPRRFLKWTVPEWIHTDTSLSWGYSRVAREESSTYPLLLQWGAGWTGGYRMDEFELIDSLKIRPFFGIMADFRYLGQYSALDPAVGNFRGTFLGFGPAIGMAIQGGWTIKLDARILGKYKLLNPTVEGAQMSYSSPLGLRAGIFYALRRWTKLPLSVGFQMEYMTFSSREITGVESGAISPSLTLWQGGGALLYVF